MLKETIREGHWCQNMHRIHPRERENQLKIKRNYVTLENPVYKRY